MNATSQLIHMLSLNPGERFRLADSPRRGEFVVEPLGPEDENGFRPFRARKESSGEILNARDLFFLGGKGSYFVEVLGRDCEERGGLG